MAVRVFEWLWPTFPGRSSTSWQDNAASPSSNRRVRGKKMLLRLWMQFDIRSIAVSSVTQRTQARHELYNQALLTVISWFGWVQLLYMNWWVNHATWLHGVHLPWHKTAPALAAIEQHAQICQENEQWPLLGPANSSLFGTILCLSVSSGHCYWDRPAAPQRTMNVQGFWISTTTTIYQETGQQLWPWCWPLPVERIGSASLRSMCPWQWKSLFCARNK